MARVINVLKIKHSKHEFEEVVAEIRAAERNYELILKAAKEVATTTLLSRFAGGIRIDSLEALITDLRIILSFVRRDLKEHYNGRTMSGPEGAVVAAEGQELPAHIIAERYKCLCPMTVFLQLIAEKFSQLRIGVRQNDWGTIKPLRDILVRLESGIEELPLRQKDNTLKRYCPGIASCIIIHEEHSVFRVASTAPRYQILSGLDDFGRKIRLDHLAELKRQCSPLALQRIDEMEQRSQDLVVHFKKDKNTRDEEWNRWQNPFEAPENRARVGGFGGSFEGNGKYKLACLLDYWRFEMDRPQVAELFALNLANPEDRGVGSKTSCAEWELWVVQLSSPPVHPPPAMRPVPRRDGMPKSGTWEKATRPPAVPPPAARRNGSSRPEMSMVNQRPPMATFPEGPGRAGNGQRPARRPLDVPPRPANRRNDIPSTETQAFYNYAAQNTSQRPARPQMESRFESHSSGSESHGSGSTNTLLNQTHPAATPKPDRGCCVVQ